MNRRFGGVLGSCLAFAFAVADYCRFTPISRFLSVYQARTFCRMVLAGRISSGVITPANVKLEVTNYTDSIQYPAHIHIPSIITTQVHQNTPLQILHANLPILALPLPLHVELKLAHGMSQLRFRQAAPCIPSSYLGTHAHTHAACTCVFARHTCALKSIYLRASAAADADGVSTFLHAADGASR
jgi:hypothetical protein